MGLVPAIPDERGLVWFALELCLCPGERRLCGAEKRPAVRGVSYRSGGREPILDLRCFVSLHQHAFPCPVCLCEMQETHRFGSRTRHRGGCLLAAQAFVTVRGGRW